LIRGFAALRAGLGVESLLVWQWQFAVSVAGDGGFAGAVVVVGGGRMTGWEPFHALDEVIARGLGRVRPVLLTRHASVSSSPVITVASS
jgi:hypothetical protein